jgi:hypothetical protein
MIEHRVWWEEIERCKGKNKNGSPCHLPTRRGFEISPGNLFVPLTCWRHQEQENKLRQIKT